MIALPLILVVVVVVAVWLGTRQRERAGVADLPVLLQVADRSGAHPACPACRSVSFHPERSRSRPIFLLVLGFLAIGASSESASPEVIVCTVCGSRYRRR